MIHLRMDLLTLFLVHQGSEDALLWIKLLASAQIVEQIQHQNGGKVLLVLTLYAMPVAYTS